MPAPNPFKIVAKGNADEVDILIYGDIGDSWNDDSVTAATFVRDLQNIDAKTLNVRINSIGGSVRDGLAIYNALARHPADINVSVDGVALSVASMIAMAGDTVSMAENALMMVHAPWAAAIGNANDMRDAADILDKMAQSMATSYQAKTKKPMKDMLALLTDGEDHWYTAQEAVAAGLADSTSVAVAPKASFDLGRYRNIPAAAAAFSSARSPTMTPEQLAAKAAADAAAAETAKAAADEAARVTAEAEAKRVADTKAAADAAARNTNVSPIGRTKAVNEEILAFFKPFMAREGVRATFDEILLDPMLTVEQARAKLLTKLGDGATPANPAGGHIQMGAGESEKFRMAAVESIVVRAAAPGIDPKIRAEIGRNPYRGAKLLDLARASLERIGVDTRGMMQMDVVAQAFTTSTSDFPILLETAINKTLQAAYATAPDMWRQFCAVGSASDFRAQNRYRIGSFGNLDTVNENGEFKNKPIPDGEKWQLTVATKGNIINLSRQMIINDDLGAFIGLAAALGRAARRSVEADVFALLAQNSGAGPTMSDGFALFSTQHGNLAAVGTVPTVASIAAARTAIASQKDVSGNDYLDLQAQIFLGSIGNGDLADVVNQAVYNVDVSNKFQVPNYVKGLFTKVVRSPRIATTFWYVFADPSVAPIIEVAFLDGNETPFTDQMQGWEVDGTAYKVRLDYGTAIADYRGAYANPGA